MKPHTGHAIPWWHSLMYSTGILILVCGIPATVIVVLLFANGFGPRLAWSEALMSGGLMVGAEIVLALVLLAIAKSFSTRTARRR